MTSRVAQASQSGYPDPQPIYYRRNTLIGIFIGAIVFSYTHQWTCDSLHGATQDAWWEYQIAKNRCEDVLICLNTVLESEETLLDCTQRVKKACERVVQAKEKHANREAWRSTLFCNS